MATSCGIVYSAMGADAAVQCPDNACEGSNSYGQLLQFSAFAGMAGAVDGYYAFSGVGSLAYNTDQAGISASQWGTSYLEKTASEVGGNIWCGYGICSSTVTWIGPPNAGMVDMNTNVFFQDIPDDTDPGGWWRATNGESPRSDLDIVDSWNQQLSTTYPLFTGTTSGPDRVLYYGSLPAQGPFPAGNYECVLTGGVWQYGNEGPCP